MDVNFFSVLFKNSSGNFIDKLYCRSSLAQLMPTTLPRKNPFP